MQIAQQWKSMLPVNIRKTRKHVKQSSELKVSFSFIEGENFNNAFNQNIKQITIANN